LEKKSVKQVIVITGLAEGMGRHTALMLARKGHIVAGFDRDAQGIDALKNELDRMGAEHLLRFLDIKDRSGVIEFKNAVLDKFGKADTVLSNVGVGFFGPFEEIDLEKALTCFEINVIGATSIFQAFIPSMRIRQKGKLIAMSSLVGQIPFPFESIYTATKFALEGMMESIKYEVAPFGIKTALIEPAQVSTGFAAKIHQLPPEGSPYRERVSRFIQRDEELIRNAPTPIRAAERIMKVVLSKTPKFRNQVDFAGSLFMTANRILPKCIRDAILLKHMRIQVRT
jgi:short-subunit dehydrogenase